MAVGVSDVDRTSRRILAAMIACGAVLTMLSFTMHSGSSNVKSRLQGLMSSVSSPVSNSEAPSR